jgi:hypothetical protein
MIGKIVNTIKAAISPAKPPAAGRYFDQAPMRVMHSGFEAQREQQVDSWINGYGLYRTRGWFDRRK